MKYATVIVFPLYDNLSLINRCQISSGVVQPFKVELSFTKLPANE